MLEKLLNEFRNMLKWHDWYYMMSDDYRVRIAGGQAETKIYQKAMEIESLGGVEMAKEIWKELAPEAPFSSNQMKFPIL